MDWDEIGRLVAENYISARRHSDAPLTIYNYTAKAQYDWKWTPETMACRGLIVDDSGEVVARPFPKFFSIEQRGDDPLPNEPFDVFEKVDGSLGILYHVAGRPCIATRGSFDSEQAQWATAWLREYHAGARFNPEYTYLFEIVYPGNRIVVDYGDKADLTLLAVIRKSDGKDMPLEDLGFPVVRQFDGIGDFEELARFDRPNFEGFVVRFASGLRVKVKLAEYKRLHRLVTGISARNIWEAMQDEAGLAPVLDCVPDEFYQWVKNVEAELQGKFLEIEGRAKADFAKRPRADDRKTLALYFKGCAYPHLLFKMLDGQEYAPMIWKLIYPEHSRPFRDAGDDA